MANRSEDECGNLVTKLKSVNRAEITSLLDHFDKCRGRNSSKYFKNFKFFRAWLSDEYSTCTQDFGVYEAIESYLQIKEIQEKLSELECSIINKIDCTGHFTCPECESQVILIPEKSLWNILQTHQSECTKYGDEDGDNGELFLKYQVSFSSSAGTSTSASLHGASTSQSENDFDESSVNAYQMNVMRMKADQILQADFLPEDSLNTWCVQCAEKIPYDKVEHHLSQKCHQLPSQSDDDASKKAVSYDDSVLSALYNDELCNYTLLIKGLEYFTIQNLGAFKHCLVCIENITNVKSHISSQAHTKLINEGNVQKMLKMYHDIWVCQPMHIQIQQKFFRKHQIGMICVLCSDTIAYDNNALKRHVESSQHRFYVLRNTSVNNAEFDYGPSTNNSEIGTRLILKDFSDCVIDIISKSNHELYPPIIMNRVYARDQSKLFTVQLKSNRSLRCLLCQIEFIFDEVNQLFVHVYGKKHRNKACNVNSNPYIALNSYHNYWKEVDAKYSLMQEDFWPVTVAITWCIKCGINLEYKHVHSHIQMYHVENAKDVDVTKLTHEDFKFSSCVYKGNVLKQIYPDNIAQFNIILNVISYPLIQTLQNVKKCILCKCLFNTEVLTHLTSQKHIKNANATKHVQVLKRYHIVWASKKYQTIQKEQVFFLPKNNRLDCILCSCNIRRKDLIPHILTAQHKSYASAYASSSTFANERLMQDIPLTEALLAKESDNSNDKTGTINSYDPVVEKILYPKYLTKLTRDLSNNNILTVRLQSNTLFCCLLCFQTQPHPKYVSKHEVIPHIAEQKHLKKYSNELMLSTLEAYHRNWTQISPPDQMLQIDFIPVNTTKCRCLRCPLLLKYSELRQHLKMKNHFGLLRDESRFLSLIANSTYLENTDPWNAVSSNMMKINSNNIVNMTSQMNSHNDISEMRKVLSIFGNMIKVNSNSVVKEASQMDADNNISETAKIFELNENEMSDSESISNSEDYVNDDTVDESETDSIVSFRDTTESDPSESNGCHSVSDKFNEEQQVQESNLQLEFEMKYDKQVEETLYPGMQLNWCIEIDNVKCPVFRMHDMEGIVCTVCKGNPAVQSITNHIESKAKHTRRINDLNVLSRLKRFHLFWMNQESSNQLLQKYFKTTDSEYQLKCCFCQELIYYENCIDHIQIFHNVTSEKSFSKKNEKFISQIADKNSDSSSLSPATVFGNNENMSDKYKVPDFNFQFKFEMKYEKSVEDLLYPAELREQFMLIDNIKYPIFRLKVNGLECLICSTDSSSLISSVKEHLNSPNHKSEMQEQYALTKLVAFHNFWMNQEPNLQMQQIYFGIVDEKLKCVLCDSEVTYEVVATHVELPQHKKSVASNMQESKQISDTNVSKQGLNQSNTLKSTPEPAAKVSETNKNKQEHKTRKAVANPNSSVLLEIMPKRYKTHLHFLRIDAEGSISCRCCSVPLKNELINLKLHLRTRDHIEESKTPLAKFKFLCEICMKIYSSENSWEKHLKENDHLGILNGLGKGRKGKMTEYECVTCSLVIFGDKLSLIRHQQWNKLSSEKKKELKLSEGVRRLLESNQHIQEVANELIAEANLESHNQEREKKCCLALVASLKEIYPQCRAYPFGSRVVGLGSRESDLDIFVDVDNMYTGNKLQSPEEQADIIINVKKMLRKSKTIFSHINPVPTARTPIIQVFHVPTSIDCDISFRHGLSVENTAFIRLCIDLQPAIQGVLLILKQWCRMCDLNNFSSYALTMMGIFYFQTRGYLLTVKDLKAINSSSPVTIDGWETIKYTASLAAMRSYLKPCSLSIKDLLHDFFEYFARYDYEKQVMCPLLGQSVLKTCFNENGVKLPPEMHTYIQKIKGPDAELFRNRPPMCIQDPFDLSHNLTKACEKGFVSKWRGYCQLSAKHLSALH